MSLPNKAMLRVDEVATYFDVTRRTVYRWIQIGSLRSVRIVRGVRIPRAAILQIQANGRLESSDD